MYVLNSLDDEQPKVFLDVNKLSKEGTDPIETHAFSLDCKWFAYAISDAGSDWSRIKIRNVETGEDLDEQLDYCRSVKILFTKDNLGFFYSGYSPTENDPTENLNDLNDLAAKKNHKIFYHRLNTNQSQDFIAIEFPDLPKALLLGRMSNCGNVLHVQLNEGNNDNY